MLEHVAVQPHQSSFQTAQPESIAVPKKIPIHERLRAGSMASPSGCRLWQGCKDPNGYGLISFKNRQTRTHRLAWELVNGPIPDGLCVLHQCDTPACINAEHLSIGTHRDNVADRHRKGRDARGDRTMARRYPERLLRGSRHPHAKFTEAQIVEMRRLRAVDGLSYPRIAKMFDTYHQTVMGIVKGRAWKHVPQVE